MNSQIKTGDTWIVIADRGRGRILSRSANTGKLAVVESFECPEGSAHVSDVMSDQQGRFRVSRGPTSTGDTRSEFKRHTAARFAQAIVKRLEEGSKTGRFAELELVVAPTFLGVVRSALSPGLQHMVTRSVARDFTGFSVHELEKRLIISPGPSLTETPVLQTDTLEDILIVEVTGNLGGLTFQRIQADAEAIVRGFETAYSTRHVIIDLHHCEYFGSTGIGFFMRLWTQVRARGGSMVVCNATKLECELLALTRLDELWPICESRDDAIKAVRTDICVQ